MILQRYYHKMKYANLRVIKSFPRSDYLKVIGYV